MKKEQLEQVAKKYAKDTLLCPEEIVYVIPGGMASINVHLCVSEAYMYGFRDGQLSSVEWNDIPKILPPQGTDVLTWSEDNGLQLGILVGDFFYESSSGQKIFPTHWIDKSRALRLPNE